MSRRSVKKALSDRFGALVVPDDQWVSLWEAGSELGYKDILPIRAAMGDSRLVGAKNSAGHPGVTRESLEREKAWRRSAGLFARFWRVIKSIVSYF